MLKFFSKFSKTARRQRVRLSKAGLREHIVQARQGNKGRIYVNEAGEKVILKRQSGPEIGGKKSYEILISPLSRKKFRAEGELFVDKSKKIVEIFFVGKIGLSMLKKGRGVIGMMIEESKQLGRKEFKGDEFVIQVYPMMNFFARNEALEQAYKKEGFVGHGGESGLYITVPAVKKNKI